MRDQPSNPGHFGPFSAAARTVTRGAGNFVTDGFRANQQITVSNTANNNGNYVIQNVANTVLTLTPPDGIKVDEITYPAPSELAQKDRKDTLAVLGPEFSILVKATVAAGIAAGEFKIPGVLRYQACNDALCFTPQSVPLTWTVTLRQLDRERAKP